MKDFNKIIDDYIKNYRKIATDELKFYSAEKQNSFSETISLATLCETEKGTKHNHQRRIPLKALEKCKIKLLNHKAILSSFNDFYSLYEEIEKQILPIHGIGKLTCYDVSLRIGAYLGLEPTNIYLHAGTCKGAKNIQINCKGKYIGMSLLPTEFSKLTAREIEDILCIYKNDLINPDLFKPKNISSCYNTSSSKCHG
jgi:hypothetical protein